MLRPIERIMDRVRWRLALHRLQANLDKDLVLGFYVGRRRRLAAEAVRPGCTLICLKPRPPQRPDCVEMDTIRRVALLSKASDPVVIVPGVRDLLDGYNLRDLFSQVVRFENGLLPGPRSSPRKLMTAFILNRKGVYFDGRSSCDTEDALQSLPWGYAKCQVAQALLRRVREEQVTKHKTASHDSSLPIGTQDLIILGQVVGDQAIESTTTIGKNNLEFISHIVRHDRILPVSRYYYKPHPRNVQHNRLEISLIESRYPEISILHPNINVHTLFQKRPRVATMTSGAGLEAAIWGCEVHTFGISFYSNWGFTRDYFECARRTNILTAEDVAAYMWLEHTTYVDPTTRTVLPPEEVFGLS